MLNTSTDESLVLPNVRVPSSVLVYSKHSTNAAHVVVAALAGSQQLCVDTSVVPCCPSKHVKVRPAVSTLALGNCPSELIPGSAVQWRLEHI